MEQFRGLLARITGKTRAHTKPGAFTQEPSIPVAKENEAAVPDLHGIDWSHISVQRETPPEFIKEVAARRHLSDHYIFKGNLDTLRKIACLFARINNPTVEQKEINQSLEENSGSIRIDGGNVSYYEDKPDTHNANVHTGHFRMDNQNEDPTDKAPSELLLNKIASIVPREQMLKSLQLPVPADLEKMPAEQYQKYILQAIV